MIHQSILDQSFFNLGLSPNTVITLRKNVQFKKIIKYISDYYDPPVDLKLLPIALYDLTLGNEIRSYIKAKTTYFDKASIYTRSDIYNCKLPDYILNQITNKKPQPKIFFGYNKYLRKMGLKKIFRLPNNSAITTSENEPRIISTFSRQYLFYLLLSLGYAPIENIPLQINFGVDFTFKHENFFLEHYRQSLLMNSQDIENKIAQAIKEYEFFFGPGFIVNITNSGTSANDIILINALRTKQKVYFHKYWYYENANGFPKEYQNLLTNNIKEAFFFFINTSPTNYFETNGKTRADATEKILNSISKVLDSSKTLVVDVTANPDFRIKNMHCNVVYSISLTKHQQGWTNYFAGAIATTSNQLSEDYKKIAAEFEYCLDPIQARFLHFPNLYQSKKNFDNIHLLCKLESVINTTSGWKCEGYDVSYVLYPPKKFYQKLKKYIASIDDLEEINSRLRFYNHELMRMIDKTSANLIIGDSFGFPYERFNTQGSLYTIDNKQFDVWLPRFSPGYKSNKSHIITNLKNIKLILDEIWENKLELSFNVDLSLAKTSEL